MSSQTIFKTAGSTSQSCQLFLVQNAGATNPGNALTGLAYNTASLTAYYKINGTGTNTSITLATQTDTGAYSSGGFVETSSANSPGSYRFDIPNACLATAGITTILFKGAANLAEHMLTIIVTAVDFYDSVRMGMTALPNAAAAASGGLFTRGTGAGQINQDANGRIDVNIAAISTDSTAADNLESYCDGTTPQPANVTQFGGANGTFASGRPEVNTTHAAGTAWGSGAITAASIASDAITAAKIAADAIGASELASDAAVEIAAAVWDRVITGANHNIANSAGKRLRELTNSVIQSGTAQAGATTTITLASAASSTDGTYDPAIVRISAGTGAGQARMIIDYVGSTRVATVDRDWRTAPDNTSEYEVLASPNLISTNEGRAAGGGANTITLNSSASSTTDAYRGQIIVLRTGTGQDQARLCTAYNGTTKVATVGEAWSVNPASGTGYIIWPLGRALVAEFASAALAEINAEVDTAIADANFRFGLHATGTLSGTHSSTTADLGGSAPSTDITGFTLYIPSKGFIRLITSYNTGTGVATFDTTSATLANADPWYLFASPMASNSAPVPSDVARINGTNIIGDGSSGNKFRGDP